MNEYTIREHDSAADATWDAFVANSANGTIYHEMSFQHYHGDKLTFTNLEIWNGRSLCAVLPGSASSDGVYVSPVGASVGGPVMATGTPVSSVIEMIQALQGHVRLQRWQGISLTLAPTVTHRVPSQGLEFALTHCGFRFTGRWMPLMVPLDGDAPAPRSDKLFSKGHRAYARSHRKAQDIEVVDGGVAQLDAFLEIFHDTYSRLQETPTHMPEEIGDLMRRYPDRIRSWVAYSSSRPVSGTLLLQLNDAVCSCFYICDREDARELHASSILFATLIDNLAERRFRYLDLGPSAGPARFNHGVVNFKEHLGAIAFCRDQYTWMVSEATTSRD